MDTVAERSIARFQKAILSLEKALKLGSLPEHAERDAILLRFELSAELMPKVLQRILSARGADVFLPKDVVRSARAADIVNDAAATLLLAIIDDRNRMVHDYSEEYASELIKRVTTDYIGALRTLADAISKS